MKSVFILVPSPYSAYSVAVLEGLRRQGVFIAGVGLRRLINPGRVIGEFRRDRQRLVRKVIDRLILRQRTYTQESSSGKGVGGYLSVQGIKYESVRKWCTRHNVALLCCKEFNEAWFVQQVGDLAPDAIIFTGGGIIRQQLLDLAPLGVLNAHSGILPEYRGMDVPEWAIFCRDFDKVGVTIHVMDRGVDTGPILNRFYVPLQHGDTIGTIRRRIEYTLPLAMVQTTLKYLNNEIAPEPQKASDGRQYFIMHRWLKSRVEQNLASL